MKSIKVLLIVLLISFQLPNRIFALDEQYLVYDSNNTSDYETFDNLKSAIVFYDEIIDEYDNAVLVMNNEVVKMEYGLVEFKSNSACNLSLSYYSYAQSDENIINACYGADAAYLATNNDYDEVTFFYANDIGRIKLEDVTLYPFQEFNTNSKYITKDNMLYHVIKSSIIDNFYAYSIPLDDKPDYLIDESEYFSYDGHYFYNDFYSMIDDYRSSNRDNSINKETPYYNYYQYLSHRSLSNYSSEELAEYFTKTLMFDERLTSYQDNSRDGANDVLNKSQLYDNINDFFYYQYLYGSNALLMLAQSIHESSYGKSLSSFTKNNLFNNFAFDSDKQRQNERYDSISQSIYSHAKYYISNRYANYRRSTYSGLFLGDRASGINKIYSNDPYWGEKVAANYFDIDKKLGMKDKNSYHIGIVFNKRRLNVYRDSSLNSILLSLDNTNNYALNIIDENDKSYKIQLDTSLSDDYFYDFEERVAYINKNDIDYLINDFRKQNSDFINVTIKYPSEFDKQDIHLRIKKGESLPIMDYSFDGNEFIGFDKVTTELINDIELNLKYLKIDSIELLTPIRYRYYLNENYNLDNKKILVLYADGSQKEARINSDMIYGFDTSSYGIKEIEINYHGVSIPLEIDVNAETDKLYKDLKETISKVTKVYSMNKTYSESDLNFIKNNLDKVSYQLSFEDLRILDEIFLSDLKEEIYINDDDYDLSISGLAIAHKEDGSLFHLFGNTYYINVSQVDPQGLSRLETIAKAYNFEVVNNLNLSLSLNYENIKVKGPILIQIHIDDKVKNQVYSVYHLRENGDIIKCRTTQSNEYIQFFSNELGDYIILTTSSNNYYDIADKKENISTENDYFDNHHFIRITLSFMLTCILGFICITFYFIIKNKGEKAWRDFKKSLRIEDIVQEEKPNN